MAIPFLIINDTYCGTIDDNTTIIYYGDLIVYRGLRMASGDVYDRDDGYIAEAYMSMNKFIDALLNCDEVEIRSSTKIT